MPMKIGMLLALAGAVALAQSPNGIWIDQPKVYDDYYLQTQLSGLKSQLGGLGALNGTTLAGSVGRVQGATLQSSGVSAQAMGPPSPQVSTLTPPSGNLNGATPYGPYGTTTTAGPVTPSASTAPQNNMTLPSSMSPSSIDVLTEMMDLNAQILNYQLLLDGSLNDRYVTGSQKPKQRVTVGFSITVDPPERYKKELENALAEVVIGIENPPGAAGLPAPSIVTLLPREKTYNVIGMVNHSLSLGAGGILAGVVNLGLSWSMQRQKAYIYQQQDTLAVQNGPSTFAWQFRPVLDRKYLSSGTRQMFVQFSLPQLTRDKQGDCSAHLTIETHWRKIDAKTGIVDARRIARWRQTFSVPFFDTEPITNVVDVTDIGGGMVRVAAQGNFAAEGLRVRVGGTILSQGAPSFQAYDNTVSFVAAAEDIVTGGAFLINRDGSESAIQNGLRIPTLGSCTAEQPTSGPPDGSASDTPVTDSPKSPGGPREPDEQDPPAGQAPKAAPAPFSIGSITVAPYSDSQAIVTVTLKNPPPDSGSLDAGQPAVNPLVVTIGGQVFGLRNSPLRSVSAAAIVFLAPLDLIRQHESLTVEQLLRGPAVRATKAFDADKFPKANFVVSGASVIYASDRTFLLINGTGLDGASVLAASNPSAPADQSKQNASAPARHCLNVSDASHATYTMLSVEKGCSSLVKEFLLAKGDNPPITVAMPKIAAGEEAAATPPPALPSSATVAPKAAALRLTGPAIDQVAYVRYGRTVLPSTLSFKKDYLTVGLPKAITAAEGTRFLEFEMADGSRVRFALNVRKASH